MTNEQIKYMVSRFLVWRLPENFAPDSGISFSHLSTSIRPWPHAAQLLRTQAEEMIRYLVDGMPTDSQAEQPAPADCEWMSFSRGGQGYCRCGHLGSQQNMVPYAAYETHLQGNPHNPKTSQPEPQDTELREVSDDKKRAEVYRQIKDLPWVWKQYPGRWHDGRVVDFVLWREEQEIARSQKVEQREQELLNAFIDLRDSVLFERGPLAEAGLSSDQVNAVLGVIDDAFPASELRAALRVYPHVVEGIKCCDVYVGDFHIKGFLGTDKDSVRASAEEFCARLRAALNPEEKP